jgi:hypothetical protein
VVAERRQEQRQLFPVGQVTHELLVLGVEPGESVDPEPSGDRVEARREPTVGPEELRHHRHAEIERLLDRLDLGQGRGQPEEDVGDLRVLAKRAERALELLLAGPRARLAGDVR